MPPRTTAAGAHRARRSPFAHGRRTSSSREARAPARTGRRPLSTDDRTPDAETAARLAELERTVATLQRELAGLQRALAAVSATGASTSSRAAIAPRPSRRRALGGALRQRLGAWTVRLGLGHVPADREELEAVVGRYGTVALAALLILMGLGAFLTWAIAVVSLTPAARVALGAVGAAALGAAGWRLRVVAARSDASGTKRFGDVLFALALSAVHVDAWGAGPALGLVPPVGALGVAALASAALAALAWRERDQALFVVGVGGAVVAPFVTGVDVQSATALAAYGWLVLSSALLALPARAPDRYALPPRAPWRFAARVLGVGAAIVVAALLQRATAAARVGNPAGLVLPAWQLARDLPAIFALACAAVPLLMPGRRRQPSVALMYLTSTLGALVTLGLASSGGAPALAAYALLATFGVLVAVRWLADGAPAGATLRGTRLTAVLLPLALLVAALLAPVDPVSTLGAALAATWSAMSAAAALEARRLRARDARLADAIVGTHVAAAGLAATLAPVLALGDHPLARVLALAALTAAIGPLVARLSQRIVVLPALVAAALASLGAFDLLHRRPAYGYVPFLTTASLAALATVAAVGVVAWQVHRAAASPFGRGERIALIALPAGLALLWGREELARAVSPEVATFLLIGYFAAVGCAALAVGRAQRVAAARQVGLALALYAALKALAEASDLGAVGLRVGSYLLVGAFLLAVGYWYRSAGDTSPTPARAPFAR